MRLRQYEHVYRIVVGVSQVAELRRYSADRRLREAGQGPAAARQHLKRDREFVNAFIEGCEYLKDVLPQAMARLKREER